jgi:hypothetical protein
MGGLNVSYGMGLRLLLEKGLAQVFVLFLPESGQALARLIYKKRIRWKRDW